MATNEITNLFYKFLYQNIQIDDYLQEVCSTDYDLVVISETWLKSTECSQYEVFNYKCVNKLRSFYIVKLKQVQGECCCTSITDSARMLQWLKE